MTPWPLLQKYMDLENEYDASHPDGYTLGDGREYALRKFAGDVAADALEAFARSYSGVVATDAFAVAAQYRHGERPVTA